MHQATADVVTPFGGPVEEIPLSAAPLIAVVAQIRFPQITSITREEFIGDFQEQIRKDYPVLRKESGVNFILTPDGVGAAGDSATTWRFCDQPQEPAWTVSLTPSFVALDTSKYQSRTDFLERLRSLLDTLHDTIAPSTCDRIGIRYVNRILLNNSDINLADLVRQEVLGITTVDPGRNANLLRNISDAEFSVEDATLHGRWGWIPPGVQIDPLHGAAVDWPSWVLDLDMYKNIVGSFDVNQLISTAEGFAKDIYRFFRWSVHPDFIRRFGGTV